MLPKMFPSVTWTHPGGKPPTVASPARLHTAVGRCRFRPSAEYVRENTHRSGRVQSHMVATNFTAARGYDTERFTAAGVFQSDRMKVVCGYFEPGQFIPVHGPESDVAVHVRDGTGVVRDGDESHRVAPGDVVVVAAGDDRGIKADADTRLEALLVTAPPPTDTEHEPVHRGLQADEFNPDGR